MGEVSFKLGLERERERRFDYMKMLKEGVLEGGSSINNHQAMTRREWMKSGLAGIQGLRRGLWES